jgi:hypothetical protein
VARGSVGGDLRSEIGDGLSEKVREQIRPDAPGHLVRLDVAGRGDPDRQLALHGTRQCAHRNGRSGGTGESHLLPLPERPHDFEIAKESALGILEASGRKRKSFGCHPDAKETPTRPCERLSTIDHASTTRTG